MLNELQYDRYSRHLSVPGFTAFNQERLLRGKVLILGLGGLGSPTSLYLAAAGVGMLGIADLDRVERHNLQRQILFGNDQVGALKTESARERLLAINPDLSIRTHAQGICPANALELVREYDVVVDCTDNFPTRYLIHDACFFEGKPLVHGNVFRAEGQVMVFHAGSGAACYRCLFPEPPQKGTIPDCNAAGVLGPACGMVGSLQAMEVVKLLGGYGQSAFGVLHRLDLTTNRFHSIPIPKASHCPLCGSNPRITRFSEGLTAEAPFLATSICNTMNAIPIEISPQQARAMQQAGAVLLDVREADEVEICCVAGSLWIPMGEVPSRLTEIPRDCPLVVYCHHGMRSMRVTRFLRDSGFSDVANMKGGVAAWAAQIDPEMARY
jgi:sulfur-carrier protein adenylyltransferase/sulfurtransferase